MVCVTAATINGVLGIQPTWQKLEVTPCLPPEWPRAEADVLYKGRLHHVTIENGNVQVRPEKQVIAIPLLWVMDFNLRKTAYGVAHTENVDFVGFYSDRITLSKGAATGTYESPVHNWGRPAELQTLEVAADLCAGQVIATVETSNDGFKTVQSRAEIPLRDGVSTYPLDLTKGAADSIQVGFTLVRPDPDQAPPLIDAFRVTGGPTTSGTP